VIKLDLQNLGQRHKDLKNGLSARQDDAKTLASGNEVELWGSA